MRSQGRRTDPPARGQALVEFALVLPILILILSGIIQFGMVFWAQNTLNQIARDTGRWAATQTSCGGSEAGAVVTTANSIASQSSLVGYTGPSDLTISVTWTPSTGCVPASNQDVAWVHITISYEAPQLFPVACLPFGLCTPSVGMISSSAEYRMEPAP